MCTVNIIKTIFENEMEKISLVILDHFTFARHFHACVYELYCRGALYWRQNGCHSTFSVIQLAKFDKQNFKEIESISSILNTLIGHRWFIW